jgi:hypothetical protein
MASVWGLASTSVTFLTANNRGCEADQWGRTTMSLSNANNSSYRCLDSVNEVS